MAEPRLSVASELSVPTVVTPLPRKSDAAAAPAPARLPRGVIVAYCMPSFTFASLVIMVGNQLPSLYVDRLGVPLSVIGLVITLSQIVGALTDPLAGVLSDRYNSSSWGRRRPFILIGSLSAAVFFVVVFSPSRPEQRSDGSVEPPPNVVAFALVSIMLLICGWTAARVPWLAWAIELTSDYHERTKLCMYREINFAAGCVVSAISPVAVGWVVQDPFDALRWTAILWSIGIALTGVIAASVVPDPSVAKKVAPEEDIVSTDAPASVVWQVLIHLLSVRPARALLMMHLMTSVAAFLNALLAPFFLRSVLRRGDLFEVVLVLYIMVGCFFAPMWYKLAVNFEKRTVYNCLLAFQAFALAVISFLPSGDTPFLVIYFLCVVFAGIAFSGQLAIKHSMIMDVASLLKLNIGGDSVEAILIGLLEMSSKLVSSAAVAIALSCIEAAGYREGQTGSGSAASTMQSLETQIAIRAFYGGVPAALVALSILVMLKYDIDVKKHRNSIEKLERLSSSSSALSASGRNEKSNGVSSIDAANEDGHKQLSPAVSTVPQLTVLGNA